MLRTSLEKCTNIAKHYRSYKMAYKTA